MTELELAKCELNMAKAHIKFLNDKIKRRDFIIEELKQKLRELKCANQLCIKKYTEQKNLQSKKPKNLRKNLANLKAHICVRYADIIT